jgi:hypothetical protein
VVCQLYLLAHLWELLRAARRGSFSEWPTGYVGLYGGGRMAPSQSSRWPLQPYPSSKYSRAWPPPSPTIGYGWRSQHQRQSACSPLPSWCAYAVWGLPNDQNHLFSEPWQSTRGDPPNQQLEIGVLMGFRSLGTGGNPPAIYPVFRIDTIVSFGDGSQCGGAVEISPPFE